MSPRGPQIPGDEPASEQFIVRTIRRFLGPLPVVAAVTVAILALTVLTTLAIIQLRAMSDQGRVMEVRLQAFAAALHQIDAAEWEAIAQRSPKRELIVNTARASAAAGRLLAGFQGDPEVRSLPPLFSGYARALDLEMKALEDGDEPRARRMDDEQVDPAFDRLHEAIQRASARISLRSEALNRRTDRFSAAVVAAAALLATLLFLRLHRVHSHLLELRRVQGLLRDSEESYRNLFEGSVDPIFVTDTAGHIADVNPAAMALTGRSRAELEAMGFAGLPFRHAGDGTTPSPPSLLLDGAEHEVTLERGDGARPECILTATPRRNDDGANIGHQVVVRDVTARKLLEHQLEQAQRMQVIGRLAGGVAHDFNNLLTVIFGYLEELDATLPGTHSGKLAVAEVQKAASKAAFLTQQLLAYSRKQIVSLEAVDLNALVVANREMLGRAVGERVSLSLRLAPVLDCVRADPRKLEQALLNLAINARDAMPDGGTLALETAAVVVPGDSPRAHSPIQPGRYVMLAVIDNGTGMSPEIQAHVFDPFFTTKSVGKGTGLGLATVYGIVKQCGGEILVESAPGSGTSFRIYLPPSAEAAASPAGPYGEPAASAGHETILVVEDEPALLALVKKSLELSGYAVHAARTGEEAVEIFRERAASIDLLVTDVLMPGMTGTALAKRLGAERAGLKVLFMTGHTDDAIVHHGILEAGVAMQQKPFTPVELCARVRQVLDGEGPAPA